MNCGLSLKKDDYLLEVPAGFHGNHPAYNEWITRKLNDSRINGRLLPESVQKVRKDAEIEIEGAYKLWKETGVNMNSYFKNLNQ